MVFIVLLASLLILTPNHHYHLPILEEISRFLHSQCLHLIPESPDFKSLNQALVCGAQLPKNVQWQLLKASGLLHLAIVSGSHLIWIAQMMRRITPHHRFLMPLSYLTLLIYVFATLANPPVVRAFLHIGLAGINHHHRLFWNSGMTLALAGLFALALNPQWSHSWSLLLSWTAGLVISEGVTPSSLSHLKKCILQYFLLLPILSSLGDYHPQVIMANWLLAPILSLVMFPFVLLLIPFPVMAPFVDHAWKFLFYLLEHGLAHYEGASSTGTFNSPSLFMWAYLMLLQSWCLRVKKT